jgi:hypothetical protein
LFAQPATDLGDVFLMLEDRTEGRVDRLLLEIGLFEGDQRGGPIQGLGDARHLVEIDAAQLVHEVADLPGQRLRGLRLTGGDDRLFLLDRRIIDPVVEAAALQRVVQLARAVRGDDHDRRHRGLDRADLRHGDLEVGEEFQQESLELLVGAVDLVDQQHRARAWVIVGVFDRLEERALDDEFRPEDLAQRVASRRTFGLQHTNLEHLLGVVPLVDCMVDIQSLVALKADQLGVEQGCHRLGNLSFADTGFAFQQQRLTEAQGEEQGGPQAAVGNIGAPAQGFLDLVDRLDVRADVGRWRSGHPLSVLPCSSAPSGPMRAWLAIRGVVYAPGHPARSV